MLRLIVSCAAIVVFFSLFGFARHLSNQHDDTNSKNQKAYKEFLETHFSLQDEHRILVQKYNMQVEDSDRLKGIVKEYGIGYFGMYQYLKKQGKTEGQIKELIRENSQGLVLEVD